MAQRYKFSIESKSFPLDISGEPKKGWGSPYKGLTSFSNLAIYRGSVEDNICISDAQYYELSEQQNLWCEILEF